MMMEKEDMMMGGRMKMIKSEKPMKETMIK